MGKLSIFTVRLNTDFANLLGFPGNLVMNGAVIFQCPRIGPNALLNWASDQVHVNLVRKGAIILECPHKGMTVLLYFSDQVSMNLVRNGAIILQCPPKGLTVLLY